MRSTTGEMTTPFTPSLKVAKTMERLRQPPPPRGYAHSRCPRVPPQGVCPSRLSQDNPPLPLGVWWSATSSVSGPPRSQVSPFWVVKFCDFRQWYCRGKRECGMRPGSHLNFVCKLAHCMFYPGRNLALLNCQWQKCTKVEISGMQWSQTV